jgi:hypothetical protein
VARFCPTIIKLSKKTKHIKHGRQPQKKLIEDDLNYFFEKLE